MTDRKMNVSTLSDEELTDLFTDAFEEQVASYNRVQQYECEVQRVTGGKDATIEILVIGLAGSPSVDQFKSLEGLVNVDTVIISREDKGKLKFKLLPKETRMLNTNDYTIVYKSV